MTTDSLNNLDEIIGWNHLPEDVLNYRRQVQDVTEQWRNAVPAWADGETTPVRAVIRTMGEAGLLSLPTTTNERHRALKYGVLCAELEAVDSGLRTMVSVQRSLALTAISRFGEPDNHWIDGLSSGRQVGGFALTEPDVGSNPAEMRTVATRTADGFLLTGNKAWISNGVDADVLAVWAKLDSQVTAFALDTQTPGVSISRVPEKLALRAAPTAHMSLADVVVPATAHLAGARSLGHALACLNEARFGICFGAVGAARDALRSALVYVQEREQFGSPLASFQITQTKLAAMTAELAQIWHWAKYLAERKDAGQLQPAQVSVGKMQNVTRALDIARTARSLLGANGTTFASPLRHAANLEAVNTYEGTAEMHALIIGQTLTGIPAFQH